MGSLGYFSLGYCVFFVRGWMYRVIQGERSMVWQMIRLSVAQGFEKYPFYLVTSFSVITSGGLLSLYVTYLSKKILFGIIFYLNNNYLLFYLFE